MMMPRIYRITFSKIGKLSSNNYSIDFAKYVVTNTNAKITYEIQVIHDRMEVGVDVKINGSTLFILYKKATSLTLIVRQKEAKNSITLNIIPS
jgi:hypothetical protein